MKIAFNPSTVAALITPPNNKDITFDLRGRNIFARGVKFCGTDTWRDIKINNVSIGSNILDLRNGSNTTLTNTNGVVTINSTWRPVVDNLTSDSTTSSLSANLGRVLKSLIDGKSNSGHTHDDRYLKLTGGIMQLGEGLKFHADNNYFGSNADARIISLLDNNDKICDGGLIIDERATLDGKEYVTELLRIRDSEFKWKGSNILHSGNSNINGNTITINGSSLTVSKSDHTHSIYAVNENYRGFKKAGRLPTSGFYQSDESESGGNAPWSSDMHLINCLHSNINNNYALLIAASFYDNNTFKIRVTNNNVNNTWRNIIHSGNIGSQTVTNAHHLRINSVNSWSTWNWIGLDGLPSWLWGSNDGTNMYVWNPSNFRVAYASSTGNADTVDGYHATSKNNKPWGTIPVITTDGYMDIGKHLEFHFDNSTGSDYSTALMCQGNYSNIVYLPSESGVLALTSQVLTWKSLTIDMRDYDESYWHPVTVPLPRTGYNKIKVSVLLNIGDKPSWAEHSSGITCNMEIWATANGWGTTNEETICLNYTHKYCSLNPCGWMLLSYSSLGVLFLRGGSRYRVYTDFDATFTPHDKTYTWIDGSYSLSTGGPYTSCPGLNFNKNKIYANLDGNSSSASKLVTSRAIWGQSFDGTANVSGTLSGVAHILFSADNTYNIGSNSAASKCIYTYWLGAKSGLKLELGANNSNFGLGLCIDTNLNVGIGTNTPGEKLDVRGKGFFTSGIYSGALISVCSNVEEVFPNRAAIEIRERSRGTSDIAHNYQNAPRIGFHWKNRYWGNLALYNSEFNFLNDECNGYLNIVANGFKKSGSNDSYILLGGGGHKLISDFATNNHTHSDYVTSLSTNGNYLTWTKNGSTNNIIVPYATTSSYLTNGFSATYTNEWDCNAPDRVVYSDYGSSGRSITNAPSGWNYGTLLELGHINHNGLNGNLNILLMWDVAHNTTLPGTLWFRGKDEVNGWAKSWAKVITDLNISSILSNYYTESEVNNLLSKKLNASDFNWTNLPGKLVGGNEFNIVNAGFNGDIWFNHLPINDRSKTATINSYHFKNGNKGYTLIKASGFVKTGSSSNYVLLGDGGHQTISSLSVNYANSAGNADTLDGIDSTGFGYNKTSNDYDLNEVGTHFAAYRLSSAPSNTFSNSAYGNTLVIGAGSDTMTQIGGPYYLQELYFRNGTWYSNGTGSIRTQGWNRILHSSNYTDYTVKKDGTGASGTWGINITGSAGSVAWGNITGKPSSFTPASHKHSFTLGTTKITTEETRTAIDGPFAICTNASAEKAFSIYRDGPGEGVKHWVDDNTYHIEYTNDEATSNIAIRLIDTDLERATNKGADAKDVTVYLDCYRNFYPSSNNTGNIGISSSKWANMYATTFHGSLDGNATTATNSDTLDGYHASGLVKFYLSPMTSNAPADSAKSWFINTMPYASGAIVYNVPGLEKTIIAGKSSGEFGHMLQLNYDDTYLRILRYYKSSWKSTDWEKISAGYADSAGNADTVDGYHASSFSLTSHTHDYIPRHGMMNSAYACIPTYNGETGWHRIATIQGGSTGYGSYILYLCGNWSYNSNTNAIIHIDTMHTTAQLTQVSGIVGYIDSIRLVNISSNAYYVDVHINYTGDNTPGTVYCYFLGNGTITPRTSAEKITESVTSSAELDLVNGGRAHSATKVIVNLNTANDTNYPLVWSNLANSSTVTENQLYKSWSDLYYNPKNKRLTVGGSIYAAHFYESSDKTLKKNIKSILSSTNIPKIREFDWKDTGEHSYGFIALELEELGYGCLVNEANGKKTVNYTATLALTVAKLLNLINIQNKKISNLTKELKALKYGRKKNS